MTVESQNGHKDEAFVGEPHAALRREREFGEAQVKAMLTEDSRPADVAQAFLNMSGVTYTTGEDVVALVEKIFSSDGSNSEQTVHVPFHNIHMDLIREQAEKEGKPVSPEYYPCLMIEDYSINGYGGMLRIFTNDPEYLWLTYTIDREDYENPVFRFVGGAISCFDQGNVEPEHVVLPYEGQTRLVDIQKPSFWYETNFGTGANIQHSEIMQSGYVNNSEVIVTFEGQRMGYYFSF